MTDYTKITNFSVKDTLATGNPAKVIRGSEFDAEFSTIQTAVNSKADEAELATEIQDRQSADQTLQDDIDAEEAARISADSTLQSNIDAEASARQSADTTLQGNIDAEASTRQSADTTLQSNIDAEASARQSADATLQSNIDLKADIDNPVFTGNVGIGTSNPTAKLDVAGTANFDSTVIISATGNPENGGELRLQDTGGGDILFDINDGIGRLLKFESTNALNGFDIGTFSPAALTFFTDSQARMLVDPSGNVGIGTSNPTTKLDVAGSDIRVNSVDIGRGAGFIATNTRIGFDALARNTTGDQNTAIGEGVLANSTTGSRNTGLGKASLLNNTTGNDNTAVGFDCLADNTTGTGNVGVGSASLRLNTTGIANAALGNGSLFSNTTGAANTALGDSTLLNNTTGLDNTAVGHRALLNNTTASGNTAIGRAALELNTTGSNNTSVGKDALFRNTIGFDNTALGNSALFNNTTGSNNTALGKFALLSNTTGAQNAATGRAALENNTVGSFNVASGDFSLFNNTTGNNNTAIGRASLVNTTTGSNNFAVGHNSGADSLLNITTESNLGVLGNEATTNIYVKPASFNHNSDIRDKTEITEIGLGLDFVKQIKPISYKYKVDRDTDIGVGRKTLGFSAQDIKALQGDNEIVTAVDAAEDKLFLASNDLIAVLFKAVQELSEEVEALKTNLGE